MRGARIVGLSPDGRFVIVATETGEELAIAADDRLRAALRGDRPRLGQLEIKMQSALSPREIQTRIRSGESVEDVARVAGVDRDDAVRPSRSSTLTDGTRVVVTKLGVRLKRVPDQRIAAPTIRRDDATMRAGNYFGFQGRTSRGGTSIGTVVEGEVTWRPRRWWTLHAYAGRIAAGDVVTRTFRNGRLVSGWIESTLQF